MVEEWRKYDERYDVSSFGNVRNETRLLKTCKRNGYSYCSINRKPIAVHQLMAIVFLNHKPNRYKLVVDHIDNNRNNNNLSNLQVITHRLNLSKDRKSEFPTGVTICKNKYEANISFNGKTIYLGIFDNQKEASTVYNNAIKSIENNTKIIRFVKEKTSLYKGICWHKKANKWMCIYKRKYLGLYISEDDAVKAYQNEQVQNTKELREFFNKSFEL